MAGVPFTLPLCDSPDFIGWCGSDGSLLPSGAALTLDEDTSFYAVFLNLTALEGAAIKADGEDARLVFTAVLEKKAYDRLTVGDAGLISFSALLRSGEQEMPVAVEIGSTPLTRNDGSEWVCLCAMTDRLLSDDYATAYNVQFQTTLQYTDGQTPASVLSASGSARSALQVAHAALSDESTLYGDALTPILRKIVDFT